MAETGKHLDPVLLSVSLASLQSTYKSLRKRNTFQALLVSFSVCKLERR
jgi:hypothetical protein